jgi:hypothetical protein
LSSVCDFVSTPMRRASAARFWIDRLGRLIASLRGVLVPENLVEEVAFDLFALDEPLGQLRVILQSLVAQGLETLAQDVECRSDGGRGGCQQLPQDERRQVPLPARQCIAVFPL